MMTLEKVKHLSENKTKSGNIKNLILFDDDVNTFDFVIETLIDLCEHDPIQAEQCAMLVHFKGRCTVKSGSYDELKHIYTEMLNRTLTASIK